MNQTERRERLIGLLLAERQDGADWAMPGGDREQRQLLRALMNVRPPVPASDALLRLQDEYLQEELRHRPVTDASALPERVPGVCLWRGDITALRCDAIVNAANSALLGCFCPNHGCIDNAIHTFAGIQLRLACQAIMARQGHEEPTGTAQITPGFNLPSRYVLHTVGPIIRGQVTAAERAQLASCYRACLNLADQHGLGSVAFCCISTGEFRFPKEQAARIAIATVRSHDAVRQGRIRVLFNVFTREDEIIYERLLAQEGLR